MTARVRTSLFGISPDEVTFAKRGFPDASRDRRERLEGVAGRFVDGYHAGLRCTEPEALAEDLQNVPLEDRGFAFEGAGMSLALLDILTPWNRRRLSKFLETSGEPHVYMIHIGAGWALARLHRRIEPTLARLDPVLGWLALDGYGFHEGFFHWRETYESGHVPARLRGYARRGFDQGAGRSLWFVSGADVVRAAETIASFEPRRRADLWAGIGLAACYAGGTAVEELEWLVDCAGEHRRWLAQGCAFAAKARQRAGNVCAHNLLACQTICRVSLDIAAKACDVAMENLPPDSSEPAFEIWRQRIAEEFSN